MSAPYEVLTGTTNTPDWLRKRQRGLGASEAPAILNLSPWDSPRDVWLRKTSDTITDEQTEAMEFGHLMESVAVELFRRRHSDPDSTRHRYLGQIEPSPGLLRSIEFPHLLASLDAVIVEDDGQRVPGQIKNVTTYKRNAWAESDGGVPDLVRVQVIQESMVFGSDHGWVLPIFGGNHMPEPIRVDRDPEFVDWYAAHSADWWHRHIDGREEPEATLIDDLSEIWGADGDPVDLTERAITAAARHKELGPLIKELEAKRAECALTVKNEMRNATSAWDRRDPTAPRLVATWKPHAKPRQTFDRATLELDHPELVDVLAAYDRDGATPRPFLSK